MTAAPEPARSLRLPPQRQGWLATLWVLFGVLALGGRLVACALYPAPVLISDRQIRETARPVAEARISDAQCTSRMPVPICDLTLRQPAGTVTRRVNDAFTGLPIGDFRARSMVDPARPDLITTDLGLDLLWNWTVTLLVAMAALAAVIVGALFSLVRNRRAGSVTVGYPER